MHSAAANSTASKGKSFFAATTFSAAMALVFSASFGSSAQAQNGQRWYQVEITVFTHENSNLELELWSPERLSLGFPERMRKLRPMSDVLQLDDWSVLNPQDEVAAASNPQNEPLNELLNEPLVGPRPYAPAAPGEVFSFPDLLREAFWELPAADHDFLSSNRALTQSAQHRILFHAAWRQPMTPLASATPIAIVGGREYSGRHELEGSLRLSFNNSQDRVVLEPNLWFTSFGIDNNASAQAVTGVSGENQEEEVWQLPPLPEMLQPTADPVDLSASSAIRASSRPGSRSAFNQSASQASLQQDYIPTRIIQVKPTREVRSNEFHYFDHPAIGIFIQLTPYEVPPPPEPVLPAAGQFPATTPPPLELQ